VAAQHAVVAVSPRLFLCDQRLAAMVPCVVDILIACLRQFCLRVARVPAAAAAEPAASNIPPTTVQGNVAAERHRLVALDSFVQFAHRRDGCQSPKALD